MGRASGKHNKPRQGIEPDTPEGNYIGMSERTTPGPEKQYNSPIPGGSTGGPHITNHPTVRQKVPVPPPKPEFRGMMAHGVPASEQTAHERADHMRGGPNDVRPVTPVHRVVDSTPTPVPVYIVPRGGGTRPLRRAVVKHLLVPSMNGSDPVLVCGRDVTRTKVRMCNTDSTNNLRFAQDLAALAPDAGSGSPPSRTLGGAILPKGMTGYQDIETQDELWIVNVAASGTTVELSVVLEYSTAAAG
jgi:hypothetical protein